MTTLDCQTGCDKLGNEPIQKATLDIKPPKNGAGEGSSQTPVTPCKKCTVTIPCHWFYIMLGVTIILLVTDKNSKNPKK